jgi:hypothetical protein
LIQPVHSRQTHIDLEHVHSHTTLDMSKLCTALGITYPPVSEAIEFVVRRI